MSIRILGFAGSARRESLNRKLVHVALRGAESAESVEVEIEHLDLRDLAIPLYDGDSETVEGMPDGVRHLREALKSSDGVIIASPEYNGSMTAVLKNAIDWTSRPDPRFPDDPRLVAWRGKVAGIVATSPGGLGGVHGLGHLRDVLNHMGMVVVTPQAAIPAGHEAFHDNGSILDASQHAEVESVGRAVAERASSPEGD